MLTADALKADAAAVVDWKIAINRLRGLNTRTLLRLSFSVFVAIVYRF